MGVDVGFVCCMLFWHMLDVIHTVHRPENQASDAHHLEISRAQCIATPLRPAHSPLLPSGPCLAPPRSRQRSGAGRLPAGAASQGQPLPGAAPRVPLPGARPAHGCQWALVPRMRGRASCAGVARWRAPSARTPANRWQTQHVSPASSPRPANPPVAAAGLHEVGGGSHRQAVEVVSAARTERHLAHPGAPAGAWKAPPRAVQQSSARRLLSVLMRPAPCRTLRPCSFLQVRAGALAVWRPRRPRHQDQLHAPCQR